MVQSSKAANTDDQEWIPSPVPRKRIKRTYSSKDGGHELRQTECKDEACASSPLQEASIKMPEPQDSFLRRQRQAFLGFTGSKPANRDKLCASGLKPQYSKSSHITQRLPRESFCQHARYVEPEHWKLINGLYNGLDTLLRATEKGRAGDGLGARSLFSSCLRKVPDYIAEEQLWSAAEDPDSDIDVASSVYSDLEALGSSSAGGWTPLREVVRAHGTSILGNALKDGFLNPSLARGLIVICLHYHAYDEAQHFVECIISSMKPFPKSQSTPKRLFARECSVELSTLKYFVTASGRFHFLYQQLATLFSNGILPFGWISSPGMVDCWNGVIWSITQEDGHASAAAALLRIIISMAYGGVCPTLAARVHEIRLLGCGTSSALICETAQTIRSTPQTSPLGSGPEANEIGKAPFSVISNILTVLCAVGLLGCSTSRGSMSLRTLNLTVIQDLAVTAHQALAVKGYHANLGQRTESYAEQTCLPFLAAKLVEETACKSGERLACGRFVPLRIITRLGCSEVLHSIAASFICAVAHCCERAASAESFDYIQSIVKQLSNISAAEAYETAIRTLCGRIAVAAAFEYSEQTNQPKHLDWALDLEQIISGTNVETSYRTPAKTAARRSQKPKSGYRWEEGICEWVAKTPATLWPQTGSVNQPETSSSDDESDSNSSTPSTSPSKQGLLDLLQMSPWSIGEKAEAAPVLSKPNDLKKHSRSMFPRPIGKTRHVDKISETTDELQPVYHDSVSQTMATHDTEDELSTPDSSQEMPKNHRPTLRELTNIGPGMERKRIATWKQSAETRKRKAVCLPTKQKMQRSKAGSSKVDVSFEDSEDELSILAC